MKTYDVEQHKKQAAARKAEHEARIAAGLPVGRAWKPSETPFGSPVSKEMEQQVLALKNSPLPVAK
jgi:hypothetical protein